MATTCTPALKELRTNADNIRVEECHRISLELAELAKELADQWDAIGAGKKEFSTVGPARARRLRPIGLVPVTRSPSTLFGNSAPGKGAEVSWWRKAASGGR